jgi:predicted dehydrogenase
MTTDRPLRIAVAGLGHSSPSIARNFVRLPNVELASCCNASRDRHAASFPGTRSTGGLDEVLTDDALDGVTLAMPVPTHAQFAVPVLGAGKHCLVDRPTAQSVADAVAWSTRIAS